MADIRFRARSVPNTVQTQIRVAIEDTSDARGRAHAFGNGNAVAPVEIRRRTYVGDNNGNDLIDVGDAYLIQRKLVRLDPTEPWDVAQNDLNASDSIDSGDVTSVLRIVVDLDPVRARRSRERWQRVPSVEPRWRNAASASGSLRVLPRADRVQAWSHYDIHLPG